MPDRMSEERLIHLEKLFTHEADTWTPDRGQIRECIHEIRALQAEAKTACNWRNEMEETFRMQLDEIRSLRAQLSALTQRNGEMKRELCGIHYLAKFHNATNDITIKSMQKTIWESCESVVPTLKTVTIQVDEPAGEPQ